MSKGKSSRGDEAQARSIYLNGRYLKHLPIGDYYVSSAAERQNPKGGSRRWPSNQYKPPYVSDGSDDDDYHDAGEYMMSGGLQSEPKSASESTTTGKVHSHQGDPDFTRISVRPELNIDNKKAKSHTPERAGPDEGFRSQRENSKPRAELRGILKRPKQDTTVGSGSDFASPSCQRVRFGLGTKSPEDMEMPGIENREKKNYRDSFDGKFDGHFDETRDRHSNSTKNMEGDMFHRQGTVSEDSRADEKSKRPTNWHDPTFEIVPEGVFRWERESRLQSIRDIMELKEALLRSPCHGKEGERSGWLNRVNGWLEAAKKDALDIPGVSTSSFNDRYTDSGHRRSTVMPSMNAVPKYGSDRSNRAARQYRYYDSSTKEHMQGRRVRGIRSEDGLPYYVIERRPWYVDTRR